jgi:Zn/Cd-binding protein ZinT
MIFIALIDEGKMAAAFTLQDQNGKTRRLSDYTGGRQGVRKNLATSATACRSSRTQRGST